MLQLVTGIWLVEIRLALAYHCPGQTARDRARRQHALPWVLMMLFDSHLLVLHELLTFKFELLVCLGLHLT